MDSRYSTPLYFFGTTSGGRTLDQGEGGGNPFASALVELLGRERLTLHGLSRGLIELTVRKSGGFQRPEGPARRSLPRWKILPPGPTESRVALVLVFSDYSAAGVTSLRGAKRDARRVTTALEGAGFGTETAIDPPDMGTTLRQFARRSAGAEAAWLYTTGHGAEVNGKLYLLPGDYPVAKKRSGLGKFGHRVSGLAVATRARRVNLIFYAGCRDDPFE